MALKKRIIMSALISSVVLGTGGVLIGKKGQILESNGDGTYSWISLEERLNDLLNKMISIGSQMD